MTIPLAAQAQADSVFALVASAESLYAARISGLYQSRDGGETWRDAFASLEHRERFAVTALAASGESIFAGTTGAIIRSTDDGKSWQIVGLATPLPSVVVLALSPHFHEDGIAAAGTAEDGVFLSNDRGESWIPWNFGLLDAHVNALAFSPHFSTDRTIFAGTESGLFRSHNGGRAWREMPFPMSFAPVTSFGTAASGRLIAGTERYGVFVSDDDGQTWQKIDGSFSESAVNAIQTADADVWLLLEDALCRSSDDGLTWRRDPRLLPADALALALLLQPASPNTALVGFADGRILHLR